MLRFAELDLLAPEVAIHLQFFVLFSFVYQLNFLEVFSLASQFTFSLFAEFSDFDGTWVELKGFLSVLDRLLVLLNEIPRSNQNKVNLLVLLPFQRFEAVFFTSAKIVPGQVELGATHVELEFDLCDAAPLVDALLEAVHSLLVVFLLVLGR